jgi:hypothetical protein
VAQWCHRGQRGQQQHRRRAEGTTRATSSVVQWCSVVDEAAIAVASVIVDGSYRIDVGGVMKWDGRW